MTWSRFDDAAAKHPKARLAGNEAWSLWLAAIQYCNRYLTDGVVPLAALAVDCLPEPISMAKAKKLADKLVNARVRDDGAGLFEQLAPNKYAVHHFLDWNLSKSQVEAKRKADRDRKRGPTDSRPDSERIPVGIPDGKPRDSEPPTPAGARAPIPSHPIPSGSEDPPTPKPRSDSFTRSFSRVLAQNRPDVLALHAEWRRRFGRGNAALVVGSNVEDAETLADRIDASGIEDSLLVTKYAPEDGMVSGRDDERRAKHESIKYIYGNNEAFSRILRDAKAKELTKTSGSPIAEIERRKAAEVGT